MSQDTKLLLGTSLQAFFYDHLDQFNKKMLNPLAQETIFYSSLVMDNYGESTKYFEQVDNRSREKILGIKLMESSQFPKEKQKIILKDIAETSLLVCGYFQDSLNRKIVDAKYYEDIGKMAYSRLNSFSPEAYDVPSFYKIMANNFSDVTLLMGLVSKKYSSDSDPAMPWLILRDRKVS
jgi:hypothetical protein